MTLNPKYEKNKYYALTIAPNNQKQFVNNCPYARMIKFRSYMYNLCQEYKFPYYINMEISEPTGSLPTEGIGGRLHWHGIVQFRNNKEIRQFLFQSMYQLLKNARIEVTPINDKESWWKYIHKQKLIPKEIKLLTNWEPSIFKESYMRAMCEETEPAK